MGTGTGADTSTAGAAPPAAVDPRELRQVLGTFVTGVTVITTIDAQGRRHGLTANSFNSVSLDPPLVLWSQSVKAGSHSAFRDAERFNIHILADDQIELSNRFACAADDKFAGVALQDGIGGVPLIGGCSAALECHKVAAYPGGDHVVFIGQVERIERSGRRPLAFGGGKYLIAQPHDIGHVTPEQQASNLLQLQAVRLATHAIVELSDQLDETIGIAVWGNHGPTIVRIEESKQPVSVNLRVGIVLPMLASASGLAFAAWQPADDTAPFVDAEFAAAATQAEALPPYATSRLQLDALIAGARERGVVAVATASRFEDRAGATVNAIAAPVFGPGRRLLLVLMAVGAGDALKIDGAAGVPQALKQCAEQLSQQLGSGRMQA